MDPNFLQIEVHKRLKDKWRDFTFLIVIFLFLAGAFINFADFDFTNFFKNISKANPNLAIVLDNEAGAGASQIIGGDKIVEPPKNIIPFLKEDSEEFLVENLTAYSVVVKDKETGAVLLKKNEYEKRPIASITKLMSALVLLDFGLDWASSTLAVSDNVFDVSLLIGEEYNIDDLWKASLVGSSNRAILSLVESTGLTREEFVNKMNDKALELGMSDSVFVEPTGLDSNNEATASDVVLLLGEALKREKILEGLLMTEFTVETVLKKGEHHMWNTDWILLKWIPNNFTFYGGKTGYIPAGGYNFSMEVAQDNKHRIQVVVLGAENNNARFEEAKEVAEWVFGSYVWPEE